MFIYLKYIITGNCDRNMSIFKKFNKIYKVFLYNSLKKSYDQHFFMICSLG